jgi:lysophospholipase L1-like esterase
VIHNQLIYQGFFMQLLHYFREMYRCPLHQLLRGATGRPAPFDLNNCIPGITALYLVFCLCHRSSASSEDATKHWVGTWAAAPYNVYEQANLPPSPGLASNSFRQKVKASIGGDTVRLNLSNITCSTPVTIQSVYIAESKGGSAIDPANMTQLKFNGDTSVTIAAKSEVSSDPAAFDCKPGKWIAVTVFYGECTASTNMTFHYGARNDSYLLTGNHTTDASFNNPTVAERWYTISGIDVLAPKTAASVAIIGNSITDGASLHEGDLEWTQVFSETLLANEATSEVGVLNLGIGATLVTSPSNGADAGVVRFKHDILGQAGLHWVIIFYGVNDINANKSAGTIYNGIKQMAEEAHQQDTSIKVYGATITPNSGKMESVRSQINDMIRKSTDLDGYIDLAETIQDPSNSSRMRSEYEGSWGDGLHPGPAGHKAMGESIDLEMFVPPPVKAIPENGMNLHTLKNASVAFTKGNSAVTVDLQEESLSSFKIFSICGKQIMEYDGSASPSAGKFIVPLGGKLLAKGMYVYELATDGGRVHRNRIITGDCR